MNFRKMHGLGNDFVILDFREGETRLSPGEIKHICDRNFGVGCDQLVTLEPSDNADVFVRFYNPDASESAACGNATRCVADILMREAGRETCAIETGRGILNATRAAENGMITVDMGAPVRVEEIQSPITNYQLPITVDMGNPHCVFFVDNLADISVDILGAEVENNPIFPNRTNVEFVEVIGENKLRQKTWERGAGITLACGSGACAVAAAAAHKGLSGNKVEIELDGGSLFIEINAAGHILMTGPIAYVFDGTLKNI